MSRKAGSDFKISKGRWVFISKEHARCVVLDLLRQNRDYSSPFFDILNDKQVLALKYILQRD